MLAFVMKNMLWMLKSKTKVSRNFILKDTLVTNAELRELHEVAEDQEEDVSETEDITSTLVSITATHFNIKSYDRR